MVLRRVCQAQGCPYIRAKNWAESNVLAQSPVYYTVPPTAPDTVSGPAPAGPESCRDRFGSAVLDWRLRSGPELPTGLFVGSGVGRLLGDGWSRAVRPGNWCSELVGAGPGVRARRYRPEGLTLPRPLLSRCRDAEFLVLLRRCCKKLTSADSSVYCPASDG